MTANEYLRLTAQLLFVLLTTIALYDYVRYGNPRRRDFVLLCATLGLPLGITLLKDRFAFRSPFTDLLGAFALFAQPYFLFRLLQYFHPSRRWSHGFILLGMVGCWVILFRYIAVHPATTQVVIFGYCVVVDSYCTWQYRQSMLPTSGTLRRRLRLITLSAGLFTIAVAGNVLTPMLPTLAKNISAVGLAMTAISAILYYIAFVPPRWLRHAWHFEELRDFLNGSALPTSDHVSTAEIYRHLGVAARHTVTSMADAVLELHKTKGQWNMVASTDANLRAEHFQVGQRWMEQACDEGRPLVVDVPTLAESEDRRLMMAMGARTWLLVPILAPTREAILVLLLRDRSLFLDDDLAILALFAQQCAILIENIRITQHRESKKHLQVLNELSEAITRAEDPKQICEIALSGIERLLQIHRASIFLYDDQGILCRQASRGLSEAYLAVGEEQLWQPSDESAYNPSFISNVAEMKMAPYKQHLLNEGIQAVGIIPLVEQSQFLGQFFLYYDTPYQFTNAEVQWVQTIARHVAYSVQRKQAAATLERHAHTLELRETELRALNATLEHRVQQRTSELERSNQELDQFAAIASHDLKAPLRSMKQLSSWIVEDAKALLPLPSQAHLEKLQGRIQRMEQLLDDLLSYARVGRERHPTTWVHLGDLIFNVTDLLAPPAGFTVSVCGEMPMMQAERVPLETVLRNLIGNAIKHHHRPTEGLVQIYAQERENFIEVTVTDNGPGIAPEFHQRIFAIFQSLKPRDQVEGSGLGLAVVKKTIESRGGTIQVESANGNGASFCFTWPKLTD